MNMRHNYNNRLKLNNNYRSEYRELFQFHFAKLKLSFYMNINPIILLLLYGERNETNYSVSTNSFDIILYCMLHGLSFGSQFTLWNGRIQNKLAFCRL